MPRTGERGGPQTRAKISEVATRLFLERGFDTVTVAEVAREAGVSSVTVFKHFPRKEDLLLDREVDAVELLRSAVRDRAPGVDVLPSLRDVTFRLLEERHAALRRQGRVRPLLPDRRGVARAGRARAGRSPPIFSGPSPRSSNATRPSTATRRCSPPSSSPATAPCWWRPRGASSPESRPSAVVDDHRARLERLFDALRSGVAPRP